MKRWRVALAVVAGVALLVPVALATWGWVSLNRPYSAWEGDAVDVWLEPGLGAGTMLRRLADHGVLEHPDVVRLWLKLRGLSAKLHAGEYRFDSPASALQVVRRLLAGDVLLWAVTIPEGLTAAQVAGRLESQGLGEREALLEAFADPDPILDIDAVAESLEGYLFPDTYNFPRTVTAQEVVAAMVGRFRHVVGEDFAAAAEVVGLSVREAVILASLIEKETSIAEERPLVSSVFHNRLRRKMKLQCDPTVRYALERAGREPGRLTRDDLAFDSPWNTYVVWGLPPGPIANPGRESLQAAVSPAEGGLLYFVAAPEGGHRFSTDLEGHQKAVAAWRRHLRSER